MTSQPSTPLSQDIAGPIRGGRFPVRLIMAASRGLLAAEHITGQSPDLTLMVGVDTQVFHGYVNCGAAGAIIGIGNVLPKRSCILSGSASRPQRAMRWRRPRPPSSKPR